MKTDEQIARLIDTMLALIRVMEEESELLAVSGPTGEIGVRAQAKVRLAARMDQLCAALHRDNPEWMSTLTGEDREEFAEASEELHRIAAINSEILERQIDLSTEMLQAVGKELERLTGRRGTVYSRLGDIRRMQSSMPLSINQRY